MTVSFTVRAVFVKALLFAICSISARADSPADADQTTFLSVSQADQSLTLSLAHKIGSSLRNGEAPASLVAGEGVAIAYGRPPLLMVSRFVIVPPEAGLRLVVEFEKAEVIPLKSPPEVITDEAYRPAAGEAGERLFPSVAAEISDPVVIRGVRLVKVSLYPVQYDAVDNAYIYNKNISARIEFTDEEPVNPSRAGRNRVRSDEFREFLRALAVNADQFLDAEGAGSPSFSRYLIAANENCIPYVAPFIEWRRREGCRVDILSIPNDVAAGDTVEIKNLIQTRYQQALEQGEEPFDQLLLVGDRSAYRSGPEANWVLEAPYGEPLWEEPNHADYKYACLEGDDDYPDVGFSRFCAGTDSILELFTGRTLGYEATPDMADPSWFRRGAVYSQHWGNGPDNGAWHISIPSNLRWAQELLKRRGFNDIRLLEDYDYDQYGGRAGRFEREQFNGGINLMLGRVETLYWEEREPLNDNTVFPIRFSLSGHGEFGTWLLLRTGSGDHLKGPVAATCGWGGPPTVTTNAIWLECVNAMVNRGMSLGWARTLAITVAENYHSNFWLAGERIYNSMKTSYDFYGDPGLKPWLGVPRVVRAEFPENVTPQVSSIVVRVTEQGGRNPISGAIVTLYAPGEIPAFDDPDYSAYNGMRTWITTSGSDGIARFSLPRGAPLVRGTSVYVTVSGRDVKPLLGTINVREPARGVEVIFTRLTETSGNGDGAVNPGETFDLTLIARNFGQEGLAGVTAVVASLSPYITVVGDSTASFGDLASGQEGQAARNISVRVHPGTPDGLAFPSKKPALKATLISGDAMWESAVVMDPISPHMIIEDIPQGYILPQGAEMRLDFIAKNAGRARIRRFWVKLFSGGPEAQVTVDSVTFPSLGPGETEYCNGTPLTAVGLPAAIPGSVNPMTMVFFTEEGFRDTARFDLQIGEPRANSPQTPDGYGYICYDNSDAGWINAPTYDWVEISPIEQVVDYEGRRLELNRQSAFDVGDAAAVPLGFVSRFYGMDFDSITIGSNGYLIPDAQAAVVNPQNWPLDRGIGGGVGMIAPLWDWLKFSANSNIYYYSDLENGRFIVEWHRMGRKYDPQSELTFQVILYDRSLLARESGDPEVLFQYKQVDNPRGDQGESDDVAYASVGISSPTGRTGVSYTFRGVYPTTSAELAARRAIRFTTSRFRHEGVAWGRVVEEGTNNPVMNAVVQTSYGLVTVTDGSGRYALQGIVNGHFSLVASRPAYFPGAADGLNLTDGDSVEVNFVLRRDLDVEPQEILPDRFGITSIYPNPFNANVSIEFALPLRGEARLAIYDPSGRQAAVLFNGEAAAGLHRARWNDVNAPAGVYLARLESGGEVYVKAVALVR